MCFESNYRAILNRLSQSKMLSEKGARNVFSWGRTTILLVLNEVVPEPGSRLRFCFAVPGAFLNGTNGKPVWKLPVTFESQTREGGRGRECGLQCKRDAWGQKAMTPHPTPCSLTAFSIEAGMLTK